MSSTATNKQPLLVDRPLYGHALITNQTVGNESTVNVQGGQAPQLLVDMDAALAVDTNNGGLVESIWIRRNENYCPPSYTVNRYFSKDFTASGMVVYVEDPDVITATGRLMARVTTLTQELLHICTNDPVQRRIRRLHLCRCGSISSRSSSVCLLPYPWYHYSYSWYNYHTIFVATVGVGASQTDCTRFMPHLQTPVPQQGQTAGMDIAEPLQNRGIYLQRGDRLYVGRVANGVSTSGTTDVNTAFYVTAQGGFY